MGARPCPSVQVSVIPSQALLRPQCCPESRRVAQNGPPAVWRFSPFRLRSPKGNSSSILAGEQMWWKPILPPVSNCNGTLFVVLPFVNILAVARRQSGQSGRLARGVSTSRLLAAFGGPGRPRWGFGGTPTGPPNPRGLQCWLCSPSPRPRRKAGGSVPQPAGRQAPVRRGRLRGIDERAAAARPPASGGSGGRGLAAATLTAGVWGAADRFGQAPAGAMRPPKCRRELWTWRGRGSRPET